MRFQDADGVSISVASEWREQLAELQDDVGCQTLPQEAVDVATQVVERSHASVQTNDTNQGEGKDGDDDTGSESELVEDRDDPAVEQFVECIGPLMLNELKRSSLSRAFRGLALSAGCKSGISPSAEDTTGDKDEWNEIFSLERPVGGPEEVDELSCTCVAWSATGNMALAGYGRFDNYGWCGHRGTVCVYNIFSRTFGTGNGTGNGTTEPDLRLNAPSGVMCVACHPSCPSIIAVGTFNGEILIFDIARLDSGDDALMASSQIEDYCHREPVLQLEWIPYHSHARKAAASTSAIEAIRQYSLASIGTDGKTLLWDASSDMSAPIKGFELCKSGRKTEKRRGGMALGFCYGEGGTKSTLTRNFIIGTEGGALTRCTLGRRKSSASKAVEGLDPDRWSRLALSALDQIEDHNKAVLLRAKAEERCSRDGRRKVEACDLYEAARSTGFAFFSASRSEFEPHTGPVHSIDCSPFHRNAFASCGADGTMRIFSLLDRDAVMTMRPTKGSHVTNAVKWSPHRPAVLACCSSDGRVFVYDLATSLSNQTQTKAAVALPAVILPAGGKAQVPVLSLSFNTKTRGILATGDESGTLRIFKLGSALATRQPIDKTALDLVLSKGRG